MLGRRQPEPPALPQSKTTGNSSPLRNSARGSLETVLMDRVAHVELIGGDLVPLPPRGRVHETVRGVLLSIWNRMLDNNNQVSVTSLSPIVLSDDTRVEPDVVASVRSADSAPLSTHDILLIVESSKPSASYDMEFKPIVYAAAGIRELWVIDVANCQTRVFLEPSAHGYQKVHDYSASDSVTPSFAPRMLTISLDAITRLVL